MRAFGPQIEALGMSPIMADVRVEAAIAMVEMRGDHMITQKQDDNRV